MSDNKWIEYLIVLFQLQQGSIKQISFRWLSNCRGKNPLIDSSDWQMMPFLKSRKYYHLLPVPTDDVDDTIFGHSWSSIVGVFVLIQSAIDSSSCRLCLSKGIASCKSDL
jgi:hypothetical protein